MSTTETTTDRLSEIKARVAKATPEPWEALSESCDCGGEYDCGHGEYVYGFLLHVPSVDRPDATKHYDYQYTEIGEFTPDDRVFMVHARADVPWLLAEVERLTAELEHAKLALMRDNEGIRLWMTDCAKVSDRLRSELSEARAEVKRLTAENVLLRGELRVTEDERDNARLDVESDVRAELAEKAGA